MRRNQKVIKNDNDELTVKNFPKNKRNNQLFNNPNLNHLIILFANEIFDWNLIKVTIVKTVNTLSTNRNIR